MDKRHRITHSKATGFVAKLIDESRLEGANAVVTLLETAILSGEDLMSTFVSVSKQVREESDAGRTS